VTEGYIIKTHIVLTMTGMIQRDVLRLECLCNMCEGERYVAMTLELKGRLDGHAKRRKDKCACLPT